MKRIMVRYCDSADKEHKKSKRQYAHTYHYENCICLSRFSNELTDCQYYAILAHEIGHLIAGYEGSESDANAAANKYFGIKILYRDSAKGKRLETMSKAHLKKAKNKIEAMLYN